MSAVTEALKRMGLVGNAARTDNSDVEVDSFLKELTASMRSQPDKKTAAHRSIKELSDLFPGVNFGATRRGVGAREAGDLLAGTDSGVKVFVQDDILSSMQESRDLFTEVAEAVRAALRREPAAPSLNLPDTERKTGVVVDSAGTFQIDSFTSTRKEQEIAATALRLDFIARIGELLDKLIGARRGDGRGASTAATANFRFQASISASYFSANSSGAFFSLQQMSFQATLEVTMESLTAESSGGMAEFRMLLDMAMQAFGLADPLVLDLGGEGINLTATENGVYFDILGDGTKRRTSFIQGNNALLYLDANGNGVADSAKELFGDADGFANGFAKLARHDANGDGVIDEKDPVYHELRLWRDLNGDGVNQKEESMTLAEAGIKALLLLHEAANREDGKGNVVAEIGTFERLDGSTGVMADVLLRHVL